MGLTRRTFLQRAGMALAVLGVSETLVSLLGDESLAVPVLDRYLQALAQPGGRKLALLVGINQYSRTTALGGCITDVELQRELLIHRFGFNASDVLTLTDSQATRENIETAFLEHLTEQAKPGDVVVFHFSGYGSRVKLSEESASEADAMQNSLVPVDGLVPSKVTPVANDLLEETLILLLRSLATDRVTTILDTSHTGMGTVLHGNLRVRSLPNPPAENPSPEELAFQEQLLLRLKSSREQLKSPNNLNPIPGIVLAAAGPRQLAAEALWNGFSAGLFTYALTQHLWQAAPATTVQVHLSRAAGMVNQLAGQEQQPRLIGQKSLPQPLLAYYLPPDPTIGSDGVVTAIEDNGQTLQLWLAGLPATVLEYYGVNSVLEVVRSQWSGVSGEEPTTDDGQRTTDKAIQLQIRSKEGLTAKARLIGTTATESEPLQVGQLVQEAIRLLPRNLGLTIALDAKLERIERVDATSAFASIPYVSSVVVAGEQPADYLFGKVASPQPLTPTPVSESANPEELHHSGSDSRIETGGYELFYLVRDPIRNTAGETGEAVKSAVNRLTPKLRTLLAAKLLRLTANEGSSRLGIRASLEKIDSEQKPTVVMQRETLRTSGSTQGCPPVCNPPQNSGVVTALRSLVDNKTGLNSTYHTGEGAIPTLPIGSHIQYRLENYSDADIYLMLLGFDTNGNAIAFYKVQSSPDAEKPENKPPLKDAVIASGKTVILPKSSASFDWVVSGLAGLAEIHLICSRTPFTKAIAALEAARRPLGDGERIGDLFNPLDVAQAVLQDLHKASAMSISKSSGSSPDSIGSVSDSYMLDVNAWATLSFIYQVG